MRKGFTLIELLATLIVLAFVSLIVIPNISNNIKKMKSEINETQKNAIIEASQYWMQDNMELMTDCGTKYISLKELKDKYISASIYKDINRNRYSNNIFVEIKCQLIEADENNNSNYKFEYTLYDKDEKLLNLLAKLYTDVNPITSSKTLTVSNLITYLPTDLIYLKNENSIKSLESNKVITSKVEVKNENNGYIYNIIK